jgi:hypothetical protein
VPGLSVSPRRIEGGGGGEAILSRRGRGVFIGVWSRGSRFLDTTQKDAIQVENNLEREEKQVREGRWGGGGEGRERSQTGPLDAGQI